MTKPTTLLLIASFSLPLLAGSAGCDSMNTVERAQPTAQIDPLLARNIVTDAGLNDVARLVDVRQATLEGGILRVDVTVFNRRYTQARFDYFFEWFDENGMLVATPMSNLKKVIIDAKEEKVLTGIAPNPRAKDFKLKITKNRQ